MNKYKFTVTLESDLPDDIEARMWAKNLDDLINDLSAKTQIPSTTKLQKIFANKPPESLSLN